MVGSSGGRDPQLGADARRILARRGRVRCGVEDEHLARVHQGSHSSSPAADLPHASRDEGSPGGLWLLVPVGHNVMVSNAVAQRLEDVFEKPHEYNPGRWSDFNIKKLPPYSFIGFGAGIHTCMGESFAFMQIRSALAVLLSSYEMELLGPLPEADYTAMVVMPKGKNYMRVRRRDGVLRSNVGPSPFAALQPTPAPSVPRAGDGTSYSMAEVSKHNQPDDCWLVYGGRVYDVTNYVPIHQGGDSIMKWAGKDATALGVNLGPQHPSTVPELLNRYHIGELKA